VALTPWEAVAIGWGFAAVTNVVAFMPAVRAVTSEPAAAPATMPA
jgi:hypothetical protein